MVIWQHHEKWDGSGYPLGLREEAIDLNARILAVADAFDAMTNERVYRAKRTFEGAVRELDRCAGTHFDPQVVKAFHRILDQNHDDSSRHLQSQLRLHSTQASLNNS